VDQQSGANRLLLQLFVHRGCSSHNDETFEFPNGGEHGEEMVGSESYREHVN
jgi:hypothetical protein